MNKTRNTRARAGWALTAAVGALVFVSAGEAASLRQNSGGKSGAGVREVIDETGRHVRVPLAAKRVVSLAPSVTETVYALGLQDQLVGDTDFCDYPPEAQKKHKVGGAINPSLEEIAALHPDLVLMTKGLNRFETVNALGRLGIPVYATDPHSVDEIVVSARRLADVLGAPEAGTSVEQQLNERLAALQGHLAEVKPARVLFVVWTEPLISIGQHTFIADALRHAGAVSIVESKQDWPQMSLEEVVHQQPEYLVFASSHSEAVARDFDALAQKPGWDLLDAVKKRRFVVISDAINRTAPRIVSAIEDLAQQLHPEAFASRAKPDAEGPKNAAPAPAGTSRNRRNLASLIDQRQEAEVCACVH